MGKTVKQYNTLFLITVFISGLFITTLLSLYIQENVVKLSGDLIGQNLRDIVYKDIGKGYNEEVFRKIALFKPIKRLKVWDNKGIVTWSDSVNLMGKKFEMSRDLKLAFKGKVVANLTNSSNINNVYRQLFNKDFFQLYIPLNYNKKTMVLEIYWEAGKINNSIRNLQKGLIIGLTIGYIILYCILLIIFWKASNNQVKLRTKYINENKSKRMVIEGTTLSLIAALDAKDNYTAGHSKRVSELAKLIGSKINLPRNRMKVLEDAALFHDIGKIAVPEEILNKTAKLNDEEFEKIKLHPIISQEIIAATGFLDDRAKIIRHHHEHFDGKGYPDGIKGDEILLESRILAIADTYDALTSDRPYRKGIDKLIALEIMGEVKGSQLDPMLVDIFIDIIKSGIR